jgi:hypothetical protein
MQQIYASRCNTPANKIQLGVSQALVAGASDIRFCDFRILPLVDCDNGSVLSSQSFSIRRKMDYLKAAWTWW